MAETLEEKIKAYANAYYLGNQMISDAEYDALIEKLKKENPNSELLKGVIGSDLKGVNKKYKLPVTMGTLDKCMTDEEFKKWWQKHPNTDLVCEVKVDGAGALLEYKDGNFVFAYSRGDSEFGEDLTSRVAKINIPKKIRENFTGYIRGEVVLKRKVFDEYFSKSMANPRNAAAGILKRLDGKDCEKLSFVGYDVFDDTEISQTENNKIKFLKEENFEVPLVWTNQTFEDVVKLKDSIFDFEEKLDYNIDGIVVKQNKVSKEDLARKTPLNNVALKPNANVKVTTIRDIVWQLKGRYCSPVAIVDPVELDGTIVSKASLANINIMMNLNVEIGKQVYIKKAGMIIPQIIGVV